nr:autotransporter domain-containing protein [Azospirillum soli]
MKDGSVLVGSIWSDPTLTSSLRLEGSGSLSDAINNVSSLTLDGTEWTLGGLGSTITSTTIQSGILRLNGSLTGTVGINSGGTLAGTGTITGNVTAQSGGTVRPGSANTPGVLTVTGDYTQMAGGTLTIQTTPSASSKLAVNGNATLGGSLSVVPSGAGYGASTDYTILTATGTLSGGFSSIASTDAGLTATANVDIPNKQVVLTLTVGSTTPVVPNPPVVSNPPEVSPPPVVVSPPPPPPVGVIDTSRPTFANSDGAVNATTVTFDGGTLKPTAPLTLTQPIQVTANSGIIDPNGGTITLSGGVGGTGTLTVAGAGNLQLSGVISNTGGIAVQQGRITVGEGGVVAAPVTVASGGTVTVAEGGGVGGSVTVQGGTLSIAPNGIVNGAVALSNGGNASVDGAVMAPVSVSDGTVTVGQSGSVGALTVGEGGTARVNGLALADVTIGQGATLSGGGTVAGPATLSGTLSPGNSPGVLTFRSPVTLTATNIFRAEIDGPTAGTGAGHHDQLRVEGAGFTAAGTLAPVLRGISGDASNSFTPAIGQSFTVVTAEGGVAGRFATLDQPASGLATGTRLDVIYRADSVALAVTPRSYADLAAAGLGQTRNQRAVGEALETFRPAPNADASGAVGALFNGLHGLSAGEIAPALNQLSGEIHADMMVASRANRRLFGRAVEARQAAARGSAGPLGESSGAMLFDGKKAAVSGAPGPAATGNAHTRNAHAMSVWGQPLVSWGRSASDGNGSTTNRRTGGFMVGGDYALGTDLSAGVALGFLNSDVRAAGGLGKGDLDSYQLTAYGSWRPGAAFLDAALGYGYSRYETARAAPFSGLGAAASGKAGGHDLSAELSGGYRITMNRVWFEPRAGLRWDRLQREGFTEEGGALLTLSEAEETENALRSSLGARFGTAFRFEDVTVEPAGTIAWEHDWLDTAGEATGSLNGARFTALSSRPGRDAAVVGAGVTVRMSERLAVQAGYLGEIRSRETNHSLSAGLRWSW